MQRQPFRNVVRAAMSEIGVVVAVGVVALGLLMFAFIADETLEGDAHAFDQAILLALREAGDTDNPIGPGWMEEVFADVTALGGYTVLALLVAGVAIYLLAAGKRASAMLVVGAVVSGAILSILLKMGFGRPRPDLVAHLANTYSSSFPSGHAMLAAVTYLTLGTLLARAHEKRRTKVIVMSYAVVLTLLIGASRVYLGVHWPTDVLAGWALGAAWAALCWLIAWKLQRRGQIEQPGETVD